MVDQPQGVVCAQALSQAASTQTALTETMDLCRPACAHPDLICVFYSTEHDAQTIAESLSKAYPNATILGCCGESIVGGDQEVERASALSLWMASLPGVERVSFHLDYASQVDRGSFLGWTDELLSPWPEDSVLVLLGEPYTFPADRFAQLIDEEYPGVRLVGGMASGHNRVGEHTLILNGAVHRQGAVGVRIHGELMTRCVVSQGCRPVGRPLVVTKADQNVLVELGGRSALQQLGEVYASLNAADQAKLQQGVHVGRVIDEYKDQFARGDFLVRNVIGIDQERGLVAIGDYVRPGQTVQFHIRDAESADEDLRHALARPSGSVPRGALLFTCNGRGTRLFDAPHHDARLVSEALNGAPLAGFFAAGELGPVGRKNFLHGFTASVLIFEEKGDRRGERGDTETEDFISPPA